jgi:hypothetical protein
MLFINANQHRIAADRINNHNLYNVAARVRFRVQSMEKEEITLLVQTAHAFTSCISEGATDSSFEGTRKWKRRVTPLKCIYAWNQLQHMCPKISISKDTGDWRNKQGIEGSYLQLVVSVSRYALNTQVLTTSGMESFKCSLKWLPMWSRQVVSKCLVRMRS